MLAERLKTKTINVKSYPGDVLEFTFEVIDRKGEPLIVPYEDYHVEGIIKRSNHHKDDHYESCPFEIIRVDDPTKLKVRCPANGTQPLLDGRMVYRIWATAEIGDDHWSGTIAHGIVHPEV